MFFFLPWPLPQNAEVSVFEVNIRFIGGLLAAYYLSGQEVSVPAGHLCECLIPVIFAAMPSDAH